MTLPISQPPDPEAPFEDLGGLFSGTNAVDILNPSKLSPLTVDVRVFGSEPFLWSLISIERLGAGTYGLTCKLENEEADMTRFFVAKFARVGSREQVFKFEQACLHHLTDSPYTPDSRIQVTNLEHIDQIFVPSILLRFIRKSDNTIVQVSGYCVFMEFVDGEMLEDHLQKEYTAKSKSIINFLDEVGLQIGLGTEEIIGRNGYHLDVKIENLYMGNNGKLLFLDFGVGAYLINGKLVKPFDDEEEAMGTPGQIFPPLYWTEGYQPGTSDFYPERNNPDFYAQAMVWAAYNFQFQQILRLFPYQIHRNCYSVSNSLRLLDLFEDQLKLDRTCQLISLSDLLANISEVRSGTDSVITEWGQNPEAAIVSMYAFLEYHMNALTGTTSANNNYTGAHEDIYKDAVDVASQLDPMKPAHVLRELSVFISQLPLT